MKLSILIPVYNERAVVERSLSLVLQAPLPENLEREIILVDDCSTDGTSEILELFAARHPEVLHYVPCFCGCQQSGHRNNDDCFIKSRDAKGRPSWDDHGMT